MAKRIREKGVIHIFPNGMTVIMQDTDRGSAWPFALENLLADPAEGQRVTFEFEPVAGGDKIATKVRLA